MRFYPFALSALLLAGTSPVWAEAPAAASTAPATLLYTSFQDHAVLQRARPIPLWGQTKPGAKVTVTLDGHSASARADKTGKWQAALPAMTAGGPYTVTAKSSDGTVQNLSDIMIGDVFLCSGQSNMEMPVSVASNYNSDIWGATNSNIRLFHVQRFPSATPRETFGADAKWDVTSPKSVTDFSATCYNFGKNLQPAIGVPVGLIEDAWGGSVIQAWISGEALHKLGNYDADIALLKLYAASPDAAKKKWAERVAAWIVARDPAAQGADAWFKPGFDDSGWDKITITGTWRVWNVPKMVTFNGAVWLRQDVTLTAEQARAATLSLGAIDTTDVAWVNGVMVGAGQGYDVPRNYDVPAGVLHAGKNVITLSVVGGAGVLSRGDQMALKYTDGSAVTLGAPWHYKTSIPMDKLGAAPAMPWLNQFGVSDLYNGMIRPLHNTPLSGIIWYQGESNSGAATEYARQLPALIADWRRQFDAETPFVVVQLPNYGAYRVEAGQSDWADMREAQRKIVAETKKAALVVTIDLGQVDNIHPTNKQELGRRVALTVQQLVYGQDVAGSGPVPASLTRFGDVLSLHYSHVEKGLLAYAASRPLGFQLCDAAGACRYVDAVQKGDAVEIALPAGFTAVTLRYGWADSPVVNLYNGAGLPAAPFTMAVPAK
ncbi:MAG: sialate O-acetylesterase [Rhizomicrobium sp.]